MSERTMLPVLPLRETVVFPGVAVPISAGRPGTLQAIEAALQGDRRVFAVAQRENRDEVEPENLYTVGTVVRISANGGYRSPGHRLSTVASPHCWGTAANVYRIGDSLMDDRDQIEKYNEFARSLLPGIWARPFGAGEGSLRRCNTEGPSGSPAKSVGLSQLDL